MKYITDIERVSFLYIFQKCEFEPSLKKADIKRNSCLTAINKLTGEGAVGFIT